VLKALFPDREEERLKAPKPTVFGRVLDRIRIGRGVRVDGVDGLMVRYAQCCQHVPGDSVVGYVTKGRGISIHRADCPNLLTMPNDPDRRVDIDWQTTQGEVFVVCLGVVGEDRRGLYADLMEAVSHTGTNIRSAELSSKDGAMFGSVFVEVENQSHLAKVVRALRKVTGIESVERQEASPGAATRGAV
jgi:GTP diphosphokinase / guanosine-3',5'-bis(diphosphate) 3'-diphosphatase